MFVFSLFELTMIQIGFVTSYFFHNRLVRENPLATVLKLCVLYYITPYYVALFLRLNFSLSFVYVDWMTQTLIFFSDDYTFAHFAVYTLAFFCWDLLDGFGLQIELVSLIVKLILRICEKSSHVAAVIQFTNRQLNLLYPQENVE